MWKAGDTSRLSVILLLQSFITGDYMFILTLSTLVLKGFLASWVVPVSHQAPVFCQSCLNQSRKVCIQQRPLPFTSLPDFERWFCMDLIFIYVRDIRFSWVLGHLQNCVCVINTPIIASSDKCILKATKGVLGFSTLPGKGHARILLLILASLCPKPHSERPLFFPFHSWLNGAWWMQTASLIPVLSTSTWPLGWAMTLWLMPPPRPTSGPTVLSGSTIKPTTCQKPDWEVSRPPSKASEHRGLPWSYKLGQGPRSLTLPRVQKCKQNNVFLLV